MNTKALVLLSGGQDSTTCLYWALRTFGKVVAIGFDYGQKHSVELQQAKLIAEIAKVPFIIKDLKGLMQGSALLDHEKDISAPHEINPELPASFTPGRNMIFLAVAASYAYSQGITNLVTGVCQTDYSGYPDCRQDFIATMDSAINYAFGANNMSIFTPLMYKTKAETWGMAKELGCLDVIVEHTHTDYNGDRSQRNPWGYGKLDNPASALRAKGFEEAVASGLI